MAGEHSHRPPLVVDPCWRMGNWGPCPRREPIRRSRPDRSIYFLHAFFAELGAMVLQHLPIIGTRHSIALVDDSLTFGGTYLLSQRAKNDSSLYRYHSHARGLAHAYQ